MLSSSHQNRPAYSQGVRRIQHTFVHHLAQISIYALIKSATAIRWLLLIGIIDFNPRTHKECDSISR